MCFDFIFSFIFIEEFHQDREFMVIIIIIVDRSITSQFIGDKCGMVYRFIFIDYCILTRYCYK